MVTIWKHELSRLQEEVAKGTPTKDIGKLYNVSKQRIFQVLTKFGIPTPNKKRRNFLREKPIKYYWLNKILTTKQLPKELRLIILKTLPIPDVCPMLGIPLNYEGGHSGKPGWGRGEDSPSLDQIHAGKGYNIDNIQIISWRANRIKNDGTAEELIQIGTYLKKLNYTSL